MSSPPSSGNVPSGRLGEIWAFLNRDIRGFGSGTTEQSVPEASQAPARPNAPVLPLETTPAVIASVTDPRKLEALLARREVLDWRDQFHFQVTSVASEAAKRMAELVEHEFSRMSFIELRLAPRPAADVLAQHIESCVRSRMRKITQIEQADLHGRLATWHVDVHELSSIWTLWPTAEWDTRLSLQFTPQNRDRILIVLRELILGANGLADGQRRWADEFAVKILEKRCGYTV